MVTIEQIKKRQFLTKKLIASSVNRANLKSPVKIQLSDKEGSYTKTYFTGSRVDEFLINISLRQAKRISETGFYNDYYKFRSNKLNFIRHNYKKTLRFIIWHEIYHAMAYQYGFENSELRADNYAINKVKQGL